MATKPISVTLPEEIIEEGRAAVKRGEAPSFSSWLTMKVREPQSDEGLQEIIDDIDRVNANVDPAIRRAIHERSRRDLDRFYAELAASRGESGESAVAA